MRELKEYLNLLKEINPSYIYDWLLALLCIGVASLIVYEGKRAKQHIALLLLSEYTSLIYCTTVIFRVVSISYRYNLKPFWSYEKPDLLLENIINVVAFVPIGFLLATAFSQIRWWSVLLTGVSISVSIEMLQLITKRGFSEVDDVIHNVLGCMLGFGLYLLSSLCVRKVKCIMFNKNTIIR